VALTTHTHLKPKLKTE